MDFRALLNSSKKKRALFAGAAELLKPTPREHPDEWGAQNRVYAATTGHPGPRDPKLTPYVIAIARAISGGMYNKVVGIMGAQMGKTDLILDVIGERLMNAAAPIIYLGPSKEFNETQFEPRLMTLLDEAKGLAEKVARGKRMRKTLKYVAGVPLRLAHAGSSTALKLDPAALGIADEVDEMSGNIKGQGAAVTLLAARGFTYADFVLASMSTPTHGLVDLEYDHKSGLEFWKKSPPAELESLIWRMFQEGTMFHWAWSCPFCHEFFIPRFKNLKWQKESTPRDALENAYLECPNQDCGCVITEDDKPGMNAKGVYVARGQNIVKGKVVGQPQKTSTASFWVSGLASPFVSFGKRAEDFLTAKISGDPAEIQTAINAGFGELYAPGGGDVPQWKEVAALRMPYPPRELPAGAIIITAGVDVQKNRLIFVVRAWGARATSWLIDHGEFHGDTTELEVWADLANLVQTTYGGMSIRMTYLDSGFRPGKPSSVPVNRVYQFCLQFPRSVFPTKGWASLAKPLIIGKPEVTQGGKVSKYGLSLVRLDTDYWKSWVHERVRWPSDQPGAWNLHSDVDDDYCKQIVSEARLKKPSGKAAWVQRSSENHFLDCEAMAAASGYMLNVHRIVAKVAPKAKPEPVEPEKSSDPFRSTREQDDYLGDRVSDYW